MLKTNNTCSENYTDCSTSNNTAMYATPTEAVSHGVTIKAEDIQDNYCGFQITTYAANCSFCQKLLKENSTIQICIDS